MTAHPNLLKLKIFAMRLFFDIFPLKVKLENFSEDIARFTAKFTEFPDENLAICAADLI